MVPRYLRADAAPRRAVVISNVRSPRLINAFSKKLETTCTRCSFYFMVYNFVKIHKSIRTTPAMEAGVTDLLWSMEDIVMMMDTMEQ